MAERKTISPIELPDHGIVGSLTRFEGAHQLSISAEVAGTSIIRSIDSNSLLASLRHSINVWRTKRAAYAAARSIFDAIPNDPDLL